MIQRIAIQGSPSPEEQAAILALLRQQEQQATQAEAEKNHPLAPVDLWRKTARSEQLNRWSTSFGDRRWHR